MESKAPLQLGPVNLGTYTGELGVEVHPMQLDGNQATGQYWLPSYFTSWNGASMVLPDEDAVALYKTEQATTQAVQLGRMYNPTGLEDVDLRYGTIYDFRVRLMDPTGGGPEAADEPVYEAPAPIGSLHFKRYVRPDPLLSDNRLETYVPPEEPALNTDPELIRVITAGMSDDQAGLGAMQPMEKATDSDRL